MILLTIKIVIAKFFEDSLFIIHTSHFVDAKSRTTMGRIEPAAGASVCGLAESGCTEGATWGLSYLSGGSMDLYWYVVQEFAKPT